LKERAAAQLTTQEAFATEQHNKNIDSLFFSIRGQPWQTSEVGVEMAAVTTK
jgi:hypothetical protein